MISNPVVTGRIECRMMPDGEFMNLSPIEVNYRYNGAVRIVQAPAMFLHDFASVPGPIRRLPFVGKMFKKIDYKTARASILHDWLYVKEPSGLTRKHADDLFYAVLRYDGVSWLQAQAMHKAVRAFGWLLWDGEPFSN